MGTLFGISEPPQPDDWLNPEQRAAVRHGEGPLVVVAGAGTGKTRVITERVRHLLETREDLAGEQILALTYTDKAASEMRGRILSAAGERAKGIVVGTFHAFCYALLQETNPALRTIEDVDHWILLRRNLAKLQLERYRRLAEPGQFLGDFTKFFSRCQDELVTPEDYQRYADALTAALEREPPASTEDEAEARALREEEAARQQEIARAYRASDQLLRERNLLTFGALLLESVRRLRDEPMLLERQRSRFQFVLVDEFQDTNVAQIELLELLAGHRRNIFVVGDDDQAIYRFRGASFGSFTLFKNKFVPRETPATVSPQAEKVLSRNYRSTRRILRVADAAIRQNGNMNRYRPDKVLTTENPEGDPITLAEFGRQEEEAHWIAAQLEERHRRGHRWREFAVLYRAHTHRDHLVAALRQRGVPFVIRNLSILSNALVRDLLAYLRLIHFPHDNVACARVLAMPAWDFAPEHLVRLAECAGKGKGMSLWDALLARPDIPDSATRGGGREELLRMVTSLGEQAKRLPNSQLFDELVAQLGVGLFLAKADRKYLERLSRFLREYEPKSETGRLGEFVEYFRYFEEAGGQINLEEEHGQDAVQLMTVHAAKGLEFDHAFVMRLSRGAFPVYARRPVLEFPPELMKEERPTGDFHVQEERRLFYVALTRARKGLTLTTVVNRRAQPSLFLEDILSEPALKGVDVVQISPNVELPPPDSAGAMASERPAAPLFEGQDGASRVHSQITRWALSYRPPVFEPLELSASAVDSYETCPQKFLFESRWGIRGRPHAAVTFGNVMHLSVKRLVEAVRRNARVAFEEVEEIYGRAWRSAGFEDDYQQELYKKEGLEQLRAFHATTVASPPDVMEQERAFSLPLAHNLVVTGRMDQVNRIEGNDVEIVDYKTGRPRRPEHARKSLQLSLYALAAREVLGLEPAQLVFYNLATNEPVAATRTLKHLDEARAAVLEVAASIRVGRFPATPGFHCRYCEFRTICPAHEEKTGDGVRDQGTGKQE